MVRDPGQRRAVLLTLLVMLMVAGAGAAVYFFWHDNHRKTASLLPPAIAAKITAFTPYFYTGQLPQGYSFDASKISYNGQILMIPLTASDPDNPSVVLTEQAMPARLNDDDIQQNGTTVNFTSGKATINDIEGRQIGTFIPNDRKTLVLITTQSQAAKEELTALLQQLQPVPR